MTLRVDRKNVKISGALGCLQYRGEWLYGNEDMVITPRG